jgi:hypothetical protein
MQKSQNQENTTYPCTTSSCLLALVAGWPRITMEDAGLVWLVSPMSECGDALVVEQTDSGSTNTRLQSI